LKFYVLSFDGWTQNKQYLKGHARHENTILKVKPQVNEIEK